MACARRTLLSRFQSTDTDETRNRVFVAWRGSWANETKPAAGLWRLPALAEKLIQKEPGMIKPIKNIQCGRCHGY